MPSLSAPEIATVAADKLPPSILGGGTVAEGGRRKLAALDGIRGVAVLAVMLSHFERFLPATAILAPLKSVLAFGWCGVDLFFVLSGFLITGILVQTRDAVNYFQSFYARRFLRIFPIYYATLAVVFIAASIVPSIPNVPPPHERWTYFAYVANWLPFFTGTWGPNVVGHFWSLAVEEQFYLLWPLCVFVLAPRTLWRSAIALSIVALVVRCAWVIHSGPSEALMLGTFTRMDSLLIGALGAMIYARSVKVAAPRHLSRIGTLAILAWTTGIVVTTWHAGPTASFPFVASIGYTIFAIAAGALVLGSALGDGTAGAVQRALRHPVLTKVGKYSYGMYVYHVPLLGICELLIWRHLPQQLTANSAVAVTYVIFLALATFGIAALSFELVERRLLDLKRLAEPLFPLKAESHP